MPPKQKSVEEMRDGELMIYAGKGAQWAKDELAKRIRQRKETKTK